MKDWRITWEDTTEVGLPEKLVGTKMIRLMANMIGAASPDREWSWSKELYYAAAKQYGRAKWTTAEKACRDAMTRAGISGATSDLCYELAALAWERRADMGIPDEGVD